MALLNVHFFSNTLGMQTTCDVILPEDEGKKNGNYTKTPVLWLLHGAGDDQSGWQRLTGIERYARDFGIAVVMPDGRFGGYANPAHGPRNYDYIVKELPQIMHGFFGFPLDREHNMVAGLSMGGGGSLKIGMHNPEFYSVVGCLSAGFFDWRTPKDTSNLDPIKDRRAYIAFDGKKIEGSEEDMRNNARRIISEGKPVPRVYHSTGTEDFLLETSRNTRDFFESFEGNPFDYVYEEDPGAHTWDYWDEHILRFLNYAFKK